jgi:hypothetical protein
VGEAWARGLGFAAISANQTAAAGRHRVRGGLPIRRLQLIGGPRLSVPRHVGGVPLRVRLLAELGHHLGLGRIGAPDLFFLFLFVFNLLFYFLA